MNAPAARRWMLLIGRLEGISFLLLLGIAMPLKYGLGIPEAVQVLGMAHGILFVAFIGALVIARQIEGWPWLWLGLGMAASVLPAGPFVFESRVGRRADELAEGND